MKLRPEAGAHEVRRKTFADTPFDDPLKSPLFAKHSRDVVGGTRPYPKIFPLQVGFKRHGKLGIDISDWFPNIAGVADELAFVRSMYTTDNDHGAEFQMHTGRHQLDEQQPTIGAWTSYGLGSANENLPSFVFLGQYKDVRVKKDFAADYLGPRHAGVELSLDPANPLPFGTRGKGVLEKEQQGVFDFANELNGLAAAEYPDDEQTKARIKSYELAFRMQTAVPEVLDLNKETEDQAPTVSTTRPAVYDGRLLAAPRLASGVRFTLVYLSDYGEWDSRNGCRRITLAVPHAWINRSRADQGFERSGLDEDVLVVCCTGSAVRQASKRATRKMPTGRDHHPRLHGLVLRCGHQARCDPRRQTNSAPCGGIAALRDRHPRDRAEPSRPRRAAARRPWSQTSGHRSRQQSKRFAPEARTGALWCGDNSRPSH